LVTYGIGNKFSDAEQQESEQLWMDYQWKLLPEMEIVYSKVSVYCLRMEASTID
jgi:hypothetical protein